MTYIPIPLFVLIIILLPYALMILFIIVYLIAGIHDYHISDKVAKGDYDKCPYFIESEEKGGANEESY